MESRTKARQFPVLIESNRLNAKFQTFFDDDLALVCFTHAVDLGEVFRVVDVGTGIHLVDGSADTVTAAPDDIPFVPVFFDPVVHVLREADLFEPQFDGSSDLVFHGLPGIVRKF